MIGSKRFARVWGMPLVLALVSALGLVAALLADGLGDALSWAALALPTAVSLVITIRAVLPGRA
ncbi:hypothetical protein [Thiohalorhabdus sp.]|uniref:hypothetical protein n=1 Tax=Thiohalorhabdus sp. TaxID=3094134 RepID=UPI002FC347EE